MNLPTFADTNAEREIIGAILYESDSFVDVRGIIRPEMFYRPEYGAIFKIFAEQFEKKALTDLGTLAKIAGIPAHDLADCMAADIIPSLAPNRARKVAELYHKRNIQRQAMQTIARLDTMTPEEIAKSFSDMAAEVIASNQKKPVYDHKELCLRVIKTQDERQQNQTSGTVQGITPGYPILQRAIKGFIAKRMTVIAAATGFGKSTLALNFLFNVVTAGHRALFISNENDVDLNLDRLCGILSGVKIKDIESGEQWQVADTFQNHFFNSGLFMTDNSPRTIEEIVGTINRHSIQHKVEVVFVDYIGEISPNGDARETEEARLARYAQKLVDCAKSLEVHVVVMAQLNRQGNTKGRPTRAELAGCFKIAQKAHSLLIFWQDEHKRDILTIDKNRQGVAGIDIQMAFDRTTQKIDEIRVITAD